MCSSTQPTRHRLSGRVVSVLVSAMLVLSPTFLSTLTARPDSGGLLDVVTDPPGAIVYVDGTFAGHTPLTIENLTAGQHQVRLVRRGYLENRRVVNIEVGESNNLEVALTADANAAAAPVPRAPGDSILSNPIFWAAVGGGGAVAAWALTRSSDPPNPGTVSVSPGGTAIVALTSVTFRSQGASASGGGSLSYTWDFGDGGSGSGSVASHVYQNDGTFTATVTVSDGKKSARASATVTVRNLNGTWSGRIGQFSSMTLDVTQNGTQLSGTYTTTVVCGGQSQPAAQFTGQLSSPREVTFALPSSLGCSTIQLSGTVDDAVGNIQGAVLGGLNTTNPTFDFSRQ